jgi:hypothetical protein
MTQTPVCELPLFKSNVNLSYVNCWLCRDEGEPRELIAFCFLHVPASLGWKNGSRSWSRRNQERKSDHCTWGILYDRPCLRASGKSITYFICTIVRNTNEHTSINSVSRVVPMTCEHSSCLSTH